MGDKIAQIITRGMSLL